MKFSWQNIRSRRSLPLVLFMSFSFFVLFLVFSTQFIFSKSAQTKSSSQKQSVTSNKTSTPTQPVPTSQPSVQPSVAKKSLTSNNKTVQQEKVLGQTTQSNTSIQFGAVVQDYSNSTGELSGLEDQLSRKLSTVSIFKQFGLDSNKHLDLGALAYIKSSGKKLLIAWEPWNPEQGMSQSTDYLGEITQGKQDGYIQSFAQSIKDYGGSVVIRFGHEMNGNWYPWGNRPAEYIAAYKYIHDKVQGHGASNVQWMWSINSDNVPYTSISNVSQFYPGSGYVDMIGIDGFNFGKDNWRSFSTIFLPAYQYLASNYSKPISISEVGCAEEGGNKPQWVQDMFTSLSRQMPQIREVIWFNLNKETDWRIQSTPSSLKAFKDGL